jgi:hypothetical protein
MGWDYVSELRPPTGLLFILQMIYEYGEPRRNDTDGENRRSLKKACPSATLSITNPTCKDPGTKPGLFGERPTANRLSHGFAKFSDLKQFEALYGVLRFLYACSFILW